MIGLLATLTVLCIGDSITSWDQSYCDQSIYTTVNIGEATTSTEWWLDPDVLTDRIIPALNQQSVDVVSILLSTNDVALAVDPLQIEANLRELVMLLEAQGVEDIVISMPPYFQAEEITPLHVIYNDALDELAPLILGIAADSGNVARFGVDWRTLNLPYPEVWFDAVHPDVAGHTIAAPQMDGAFAGARFVPGLDPAGIATLLSLLGATAWWRLRGSASTT